MLITGSHAIVIIICGFWTTVLRFAAGSRAINRVGDNEETIGKRPSKRDYVSKNSFGCSTCAAQPTTAPIALFCLIDCSVCIVMKAFQRFSFFFFFFLGKREAEKVSVYFRIVKYHRASIGSVFLSGICRNV